MSETRGTLFLLSRVPRIGQTKTRLIPHLGAERAAAFHRASLEDLLAEFGRVRVADRIVAWADSPEPSDAVPAIDGPWRVTEQGEGDLGRRMQRLWDTARAVGPAVFIGADAPTQPPGSVAAAIELLADGCDAVFQPAMDGGYVLAAFGTDPSALLEGIPWGTTEVLSETLDRGATSRRRIGLLDPWYDVDTGRDLEVLRSHLRVLDPAVAPATRRFLDGVGES